MDQDKFKKAYSYATQNPQSEFAVEFKKRAKQGDFNTALSGLGVDTSQFKKAPPKDTSFTGKLKSIGSSLIKSEKGFGESIAGAIQTTTGIGTSGDALNQAQQSKQDTIGQLVNRIQEKREAGEDTTRLMKVLQDLSGTQNLDESTFNLLKDKTAKQVIGEGVGVAADIIGAGTVGTKVPGIVTKPTSLISGAVQGAKTGAKVGAGFGAVQGGARAAQDDESIVGGAISGGIGGAVVGGALGGITGGVSGGIRGRGTVTQKTVDSAVDNITPTTREITPTQYADFVKSGRIIPKTKTSPARLVLTSQEQNVVKKFPELISKDPVVTAINISNKLSKLDDEVGVFLKANDGIFNNGELKNSIIKNLDEITDVTISEKRLNKLKTQLVDNFVKSVKTNKMSSLWEARKVFDKQIKKAFSGSPTLQKEVKRELRNAVQDFLSERTTSSTYTNFMQDMSGLLRLQDIAILKGGKEKVASGIGLWIKQNPLKSKALGLIGGGAIAAEYFSD